MWSGWQDDAQDWKTGGVGGLMSKKLKNIYKLYTLLSLIVTEMF